MIHDIATISTIKSTDTFVSLFFAILSSMVESFSRSSSELFEISASHSKEELFGPTSNSVRRWFRQNYHSNQCESSMFH